MNCDLFKVVMQLNTLNSIVCTIYKVLSYILCYLILSEETLWIKPKDCAFCYGVNDVQVFLFLEHLFSWPLIFSNFWEQAEADLLSFEFCPLPCPPLRNHSASLSLSLSHTHTHTHVLNLMNRGILS